ncbi:bacterio-opsin activator domain-containing protein [Natronobiforma cellulositropha]|uniref:bacterio-opsin activator domain-containing protein n=1 Tax=Natronobiforma cellulositropha TaxID=1679076 RepID=UPI0021D5CEC9|nr:bacterio-opsin activator domain-containing protein [Natronobiforma cellulositropha]
MNTPITALVVDNDPGFTDLAASMLEREDEALRIETAVSADAALEAIREPGTGVDCIVSDYEMPGMSGLDLLEAVRETDPDLPFILFTGKGSEEIASEAIAAGVTQYLQKKPGRDRYTLLANQIKNAVSQYRTELELRESERRYERTLAALHETTRDLMRASTKEEIYTAAVETAGEVLESPIVAIYAFDPADGALTHAASTASSSELLDPEVRFERGEGLVWEVFSEGEAAYYEDTRRAANVHNPETLSRSELIVPLGTHGVFVAGAEVVDGFDETMTELMHILAANTEAALDRAEREQLLREHDRTLTQQNEELTRLNHTNEIVRKINRAVAQASTRQEIESAVCERLAETDRYLFAWIATTETSRANGTEPTPSDWAGIDPTYIDSVREDGPDAPEAVLIRRTVDERTAQLVPNVLDDHGWKSRRKEALTFGFQTVLSVPLVDNEHSYGALVVHAPPADAFTAGERAVLTELGETIGHAIHSVERTRSLLTDNRLELELACRDSRLLLNRLSKHVDAELTLEGAIDREDGSVVFFVSVADPPVETLCALADRWASVETISVVSEGEETTLFEITGCPTAFVDVLRENDAQLRSATAANGSATLVLDVPQRVNARSVIEAIRDEYPETDLHAKRETTTQSARRLDAQLRERVTGRQYEALQAAHYSGFFDWPRESTGEDLAAALDVSPPTYHYHLRAAERKLVSMVFDSDSN